MRKSHKIGLAILMFFFCTGFDRITKDFAQKNLSVAPAVSLLNDSIRIQYSENLGGMLSIGANLPSQLRVILFVILAGIVLTNTLRTSSPTQRAPDWWDSARFQAVCVASS